jgi:phage/plasmid-like protein (TIGR03299 family)
MAHELMNDNAMFYVGQTPWHGLGNKLEIEPNTKEALKLSGLDWTVTKAETYIRVGGPSGTLTIGGSSKSFSMKDTYNHAETGYCCTYRLNADLEPVILGHVSKKYEVLQNKDAFQPFDEVLLDHGYTYETAGAVKDGQKIWILAKAPYSNEVGKDKIDRYVLLFNSHNGSTGVTMKPTMIRVVCNNTLEYALNQKSDNGISLRHTIGVKDRLSTLTEALRACDANVEEALEVMRRMNEAELTDEVMTKYFETVFPTLINREQESYHPTTKRKIPNFAKPHYEALVANYRHGKGNNGKTMWDAYNSITEYVDHTKNYSDPVASIGFGWGKNIKQHAFKVGSKFITN